MSIPLASSWLSATNLMQIINTATNASIGGVRIPVGAFEVPFHGTVGIITENQATNALVGVNDTLFVWAGGFEVRDGFDPYLAAGGGLFVVVSVFGLLAMARRLARQLQGTIQREV